MAKSTLVDRILQSVEECKDLAKIAGIEDTAPAEGVVSEHVKSPEAGEIGVISDIHTNVHENEDHELPGAASDIIESKPDTGAQQGLDVADVPTNEDVNAEEILNAVTKSANAVRAIAMRIGALSDAEIDHAFSKQASAENAFEALSDEAKTMLVEDYIAKQADAGDPACQSLIDYATSFHLGMLKRANDQAALEEAGMTPEDADAALQMAAEENPYGVLMDEEGNLDEDIDPEDLPEEPMMEEGGEDLEGLEGYDGSEFDAGDLDVEEGADAEEIGQAMSAEIEAEAAELTAAIAEDIMAEDPSIPEEEALAVAEEQVADAIDTAIAQQAIGATDEEGDFTMADEDAAAVVDDMEKTASAFPLRGVLTQHINDRLGLNPSMFASRLGF